MNRIECQDYREFLGGLEPGSVDLILTDPPYGISRDDYNFHGYKGREHNIVKDFGDWDVAPDLPEMTAAMIRTLRPGGTAIVFFNLWRTSYLADAMRDSGFSILRMVHWVKTNPMPTNSKVSYLSTAVDTAICGVKGGKGTFNSDYDTGIYRLPTQHTGKKRVHPTQKPIDLFTALVEKHSDPGDLVVDPFLGSGTTAFAATSTARRFAGCDISPEYVEAARARIADGGLLDKTTADHPPVA